ncbi:ABC transporter ATP-binding protein [Streptomyces sp. NPDC054784]
MSADSTSAPAGTAPASTAATEAVFTGAPAPAAPAAPVTKAAAGDAADGSSPHPDLRAHELRLAYDGKPVVDGLDLAVPPGRITAIVGANACGKSTLLRALARLLTPRAGAVRLDGRALQAVPARELARRLGILPQGPVAPEGLTVIDLVNRGRSPHQTWWRQWSRADEEAVHGALAATGMTELAHRPVDELSGGQRQRAWIAMAVAQGTPVLLLDEPTTYLDLAHQIDVLDLITDLNRSEERTVVMVLHDLNQACRYADHVIAMKHGRIVAEGAPNEVITAETVEDVFSLRCRVGTDPVSGTPLVLPMGRHHGAAAAPEGATAAESADVRLADVRLTDGP